MFASNRVVMFLMALLAGACLAACSKGGELSPEDAAVAGNVRLVFYNLTEWAKQNGGLYPEQLNADMLKDAQNETIKNPYTKSDVFPVAFGSAEAGFGNLCYVPIHDGIDVTGYILLGFGNDLQGGEDVDGDGAADNVVIHIFPGNVTEEQMQSVMKELR